MTTRTALRSIVMAGLLVASGAHADPVVVVNAPDPDVLLEQITGEGAAFAIGPGGTASGTSRSWSTACRAPCGQRLSTIGYYFVDGPGITDSRKFLLPDADEVELDVKPGHTWEYVTGLSTLCIGAGLAGSGVVMLGAGAAGVPGHYTGAAEALLVVGLPVAAVGLVVMLHGRTTIDIRPRRAGATAIRLDVSRGALTF